MQEEVGKLISDDFGLTQSKVFEQAPAPIAQTSPAPIAQTMPSPEVLLQASFSAPEILTQAASVGVQEASFQDGISLLDVDSLLD